MSRVPPVHASLPTADRPQGLTRPLHVGTPDGLLTITRDGRTQHSLEGVPVTCLLAFDDGTVYAGTSGKGLLRRDPGAEDFEDSSLGLSDRDVTSLGVGPGGLLYVGMEPANLHVCTGGAAWHEMTGLRMAGGARKWHAPWGTPDLSTILPDPTDAQRIFVGVEVGGVYMSEDGGVTWEPRGGGIDYDVHRLVGHAQAPGILYAATGGGIYRSRDAGKTWQACNDGLDRTYAPVLAMQAEDPNVLVAAVAFEPPGERTRVHVSRDGGDHWEPAPDPLPGELAGVLRDALIVNPAVPGGFLLGTVDGEIWAGSQGGQAWTRVATGMPRIHALALPRPAT